MKIRHSCDLLFEPNSIEPCHFEPDIVKAIPNRSNKGEKSAE